jgi:chromosome segregation ATPase
MRVWLDHILRYSRRDQLSLLVALDTHPIEMRALPLENRETRWHRWPKIDASLGRRRDTRSLRFEHSIRAPLSRLREIEGPTADRIRALEESAQAREGAIKATREEIESLRASVTKSQDQMDRLAQENQRLNAKVADYRVRVTDQKARLSRTRADLQRIRKSRSYRVARKVSRAIRLIAEPVRRMKR